MKTTVTINAKLYSTLFNEGVERGVNSDTLISVYCFIKAAKEGKDRIRPIETKNGREIKYYRLLHKVTKLSEKTLKKYVPILEELSIFNFSKDGSCYLKGNDKTNKEQKSRKIIKLDVAETISNMNLNVLFVRVKTKEKRIKSAIERNNSKIKVISRLESNQYVNHKDIKRALKWRKEGVTLEKLKSHHNKVVLSNAGFYYLKGGVSDKVVAGNYWKNRLKSAGKIKTRRNITKIQNCIKSEYYNYKYSTNIKGLFWSNGSMFEETISEFTTTDFAEKRLRTEKVKPLSYLQFDMIAFWKNS